MMRSLIALATVALMASSISPAEAQFLHGNNMPGGSQNGSTTNATSQSTANANAASKALAVSSQQASPSNTIQQGGSYIAAPNFPVATAYAPALAAMPASQCVLGDTASVGVQTFVVGVSGGYGKTSPYKECNIQNNIRIIAGFPPSALIGGVPAPVLATTMALQLSGVSEALNRLNPPVIPRAPGEPVPTPPAAQRPVFDPNIYSTGSECLNAASAQGAPLSVCSGKS